MELRKLLLLLPIVFVVFTSGCTSIPICVPFLNIGDCGPVVFEDDILIIKSLDALPQTVSPGQQIRLVGYIQNIGKDTVPHDKLSDKLKGQKITVNLYDYCKGLFSEIKVNCPDGQSDCIKDDTGGCKCEISKLLPGEVKEIDWILKAGNEDQVPLKTECDLKVAVTYPYKTTSLTDITFIDYHEMQNQVNDGTYRSRDSYIVAGYGPVKPIITVEDRQPIPVQQGEAGKTVVALRVKNGGAGYVCRLPNTLEGQKDEQGIVCDSKIPKDNVRITGIGKGNLLLSKQEESTCKFEESADYLTTDDDVVLIRKESPPYLCEIELSESVNLPKETTEHVITTVEYLYEFRKEIEIVIEPKI